MINTLDFAREAVVNIEDMRLETVFEQSRIKDRVRELGRMITEDYKGKKMLVISLLKGSFVFTADLVREIELPVKIEFITTSMYGAGSVNTGKLQINDPTSEDLSDYDVLVVDDITDTALTMTGVLEHLRAKSPKSLRACVLLDKPSRRRTEYTADYIGFEIPDLFVVGYGLNYGDHYRNERDILAFVEK